MLISQAPSFTPTNDCLFFGKGMEQPTLQSFFKPDTIVDVSQAKLPIFRRVLSASTILGGKNFVPCVCENFLQGTVSSDFCSRVATSSWGQNTQ